MNKNMITKVADHSVVVDANGNKIKPKVKATVLDYEKSIVEVLGWKFNDRTFQKFLKSTSLEHDKVIVHMYHNGFGVN